MKKSKLSHKSRVSVLCLVAPEELGLTICYVACGTAVIVTPVKSITKGQEKITIGENYEILAQLYQDVRALQTGEAEDKYGW